jgi:hypothetical protein
MAGVEPDFRLGKRDFRHGFHHMIIVNEDRVWMGFRFPGEERFGRWRALDFGLS